MKGRFFSKGIFAEQFRQLKIVGIIGCVIYVLFGVFSSIGINISQLGIEEYNPDSFSVYVESVNSVYLCTVQLLIPLIFVPLLMLAGFHFLTKRSSSDFFHALPVKREAMYTGTLAAVFAWAFIITVLPLIVMWVVCIPLNAVDFAFAELLKAALNTLVSSVFIMGVMAFGINISGTLFTNIISSGIILLLPRFILVMLWVISGDVVANSVIDFHFVRLMLYGNPITKVVYIVGTYGDIDFAGFVMSGLAAGVVEGLVYIFAGGLFFKLRKSESASMSSVNRGVQSVIRHLLALVFSTIASVFIVEHICFGTDDEFVIFMAVLFYVLALVVYFLYELVTTRKWKSAAKSARQLPFLFCVTAAVFAVTCVISINGNNYRMNAENAEFIKVIGAPRVWGGEYFFNENDFPIEIKSEDIKNLITEAYNRAADGEAPDSVCTIAIAIKEGGFTRKRYVRLNEKDMGKVMGEIYSVIGVNISERLPDIRDMEGRYRIELYWNIENPCVMTVEDIKRVYAALRSEILESENPAAFLYRGHDKTVCTIELRNLDSRETIELPIGVTTPEAFRTIQEIIKEHNEAQNFAELYDTVFDKASDNINVEGCILFASDKYNGMRYYGVSVYLGESGVYEESVLSDIYDILKKYDPNGDVAGENVVIEGSGWYYGTYGHTFGIYNLSDIDIEKLRNILYNSY